MELPLRDHKDHLLHDVWGLPTLSKRNTPNAAHHAPKEVPGKCKIDMANLITVRYSHRVSLESRCQQ